jgi:hypothetical protein
MCKILFPAFAVFTDADIKQVYQARKSVSSDIIQTRSISGRASFEEICNVIEDAIFFLLNDYNASY